MPTRGELHANEGSVEPQRGLRCRLTGAPLQDEKPPEKRKPLTIKQIATRRKLAHFGPKDFLVEKNETSEG